jgi:hypothetical protein
MTASLWFAPTNVGALSSLATFRRKIGELERWLA